MREAQTLSTGTIAYGEGADLPRNVIWAKALAKSANPGKQPQAGRFWRRPTDFASAVAKEWRVVSGGVGAAAATSCDVLAQYRQFANGVAASDGRLPAIRYNPPVRGCLPTK